MTAVEHLSAALADRYAIQRELGQGGMATVYLAHDKRHDRKVALKVLRPELSAILGADRFLAEIKTTANLQHPHILSLFDSGEANGLVFYVMPYVEGESLRDKLSREKQLPVDEALRIAREVADALQYAHQHGIVHRDIKPEDILLHGGHARVADFGIALAAAKSDGGTRMTETGMSLGTPHYMSPEQAMGQREITPRSDVYALGCVLYEMLLGEPPFTGPTAQSIIAKVMTEDPRPITIHRRSVPPYVEAAVLGALQKLPADRFATAAEFAAALSPEHAMHHSASLLGPGVSVPAPRRAALLPWAVTAVAVLVAAGLGARAMRRGGDAPTLRLTVPIPSEAPPLVLRLSPDGSTLAYVAAHADRLSIHTRRLDELEPRQLTGTDDAYTISWSPDGRWLAFLGSNQVRKVPATGGSAVPITMQGAPSVFWIEWLDDETFVVQTNAGLATLGSDGTLSYFYRPSGREQQVAIEQVLPDGTVLARVWRTPPQGPIVVIDPGSGDRDTVLDVDAAWANYSDGVLAWMLSDGTLFAAPWRPGQGRLRAAQRPLGATAFAVRGFAAPATMSAGNLIYAPTRSRALVRAHRDGRVTELMSSDRTWHSPRVSPDGRQIALDFSDQQRDVWLLELADSTLTRFGFDSSAHDPTWLPDGSGLVFAAVRGPITGAHMRRLNGARAESVLTIGEQFTIHTVTRDGRTGIGVAINGGAFDLLATSIGGPRRVDTLLNTSYNEGFPALSPDNRLLAYASDESGRNEVYLRRWPDLSGRLQVSQSGGSEPVWSRDGRELFYRSAGGAQPMLVAATVEAGATLRIRSRTELFAISTFEFATPHANYDVFPDGRSFVMVRQGRPNQLAEVVYLQNVAGLLSQAR